MSKISSFKIMKICMMCTQVKIVRKGFVNPKKCMHWKLFTLRGKK